LKIRFILDLFSTFYFFELENDWKVCCHFDHTIVKWAERTRLQTRNADVTETVILCGNGGDGDGRDTVVPFGLNGRSGGTVYMS
jgi:hypothetical protein